MLILAGKYCFSLARSLQVKQEKYKCLKESNMLIFKKFMQ